MKRVRITNRPDGLGLEVSGLEHAEIRRLVLVADPLVPPRVFLELQGHEVDIDLGAVLAAESGLEGLWPAAAAVTESPAAAAVTESAEEFRARQGRKDFDVFGPSCPAHVPAERSCLPCAQAQATRPWRCEGDGCGALDGEFHARECSVARGFTTWSEFGPPIIARRP